MIKGVKSMHNFIVILTCDLFDCKINRAHPQLMKSLCVKFHDCRCKGKAIMRPKKKDFSNQCIVTLTFDLLNQNQ